MHFDPDICPECGGAPEVLYADQTCCFRITDFSGVGYQLTGEVTPPEAPFNILPHGDGHLVLQCGNDHTWLAFAEDFDPDDDESDSGEP